MEQPVQNAWKPVDHSSTRAEVKFRTGAAGHASADCFDCSPEDPKSTFCRRLLSTAARGSRAQKQGATAEDGRCAGVARTFNVIRRKTESSRGTHSAPYPRIDTNEQAVRSGSRPS
jgi:hypothetical protein